MNTQDNKAVIPEKWSLWKSKRTGKIYRVENVANITATKKDWPISVLFEDVAGTPWCCSLDKFLDKKEFVSDY